MRIHVNLLSKQAQARVHKIRFSRLLRWSLAIVLLTDVAIVGILHSGNLLLTSEATRLKEVANENQKLYDRLIQNQFENKISLEEEISALTQLQKNYPLWTQALTPITNDLGPDLRLQSIHFTLDRRTFSLAGIAPTRTALIDYRERLLGMDFIETIDAPLSSFTQKENISFEFNGTFHPVTLESLP